MAAACVALLLLLLLLAAAVPDSSETSACRLRDCPNYRAIRFYEELGCTRSDGAGDCCPTRFDCSSLLSLDRTKCHYDGKTYRPGAEITSGIKSVCTPACSCYTVDDGPWKGEARFSCAAGDCAGYPIPAGRESVCYPTYRMDRCCGTGINCVNDTKSPRNVTECTYKGKTYLEGQFIEGVESECMRCVCQKGYDGTLREPWCRRRSCDYRLWWPASQLLSCAPVFSDDDQCCATDFHCPSDDVITVQHSETTTALESDHCTFGNHTLQTGDEFWWNDGGCIKCACQTSPFLTCVKLPDGNCPVNNKQDTYTTWSTPTGFHDK